MKKSSKNLIGRQSIKSTGVPVENVKLRKKLVKKGGKVLLSAVSTAFILGSAGLPARAIDIDPPFATNELVGSEEGKEAINQVLKVAKGKPALAIAVVITCAGCAPVAGVMGSPGLCIACGILIAKVIG